MNKKCCVLHITGVTPSGGIYTFLKNIQQHVDNELFEMRYIFSMDKKTQFFLNSFSSENVKVLPSLHLRNIFLFFKMLNGFYKEECKNIDMIHIHSPNIALPHLLFSKIYGIKVRVLHSHNTKHADVFFKKIRNFLFSCLNNSLVNARLACSKIAGDFLFSKKDFFVIKNGIDLSVFRFDKNKYNAVRKKLRLMENKVYGHVGGFLPQKNHKFLLQIFSEIIKREPNAKLLLVGDGVLKHQIEKSVISSGLENDVYFLGQRDDVADLIQAMDVFLFPSVFEGLGFVVIEAQAAGLPCFASDQVPEESKVTDLIKYIPLTKSATEWSELIINNTQLLPCREEYELSVKNSGYDIHDCVESLQNFYLSQLRNSNV